MKQEIKDAVTEAQRLIKEGKYHIPIDVHQVAVDLGLKVTEQDLEEQISGVLVIKGERGTIGVNANHHLNRQRFTIAHEIGHYQLHRKRNPIFIDATPVFFRNTISTEGRSLEEMEANSFAAELLMPQENIQAVLHEQFIDAFDDTAIRRIAGMFGVSAQALTIRLTRLNLISLG